MQKILNILFFVMSAISYGQVTVLTDVNTKEPKQNEPVVLTIVQEVVGENMEQQSPLRLPDLSKFDIVGSASEQNTFIDQKRGIRVNQIIYQLYLQPKVTGKVKIGSALLTVNGKIYKSEPFDILVKETSRAETEYLSKDVYLNVEVQDKEVYENQPTVAVLRAYSKNYDNFRKLENIKFPQQNNARIKPISYKKQDIENVNGEMASQVIAMFIIFPEEAGNVEIEPVSAMVKTPEISKIVSNKVKINVKTLPKDSPENFKNAVGKFQVSIKEIAKTEPLEVNKPIDVLVKISGLGNLDEDKLPKLIESKDYTFFKPQIISKLSTNKDGVKGSITAKYVVIPKHEGKINISTEPFSFFNPELNQYIDLGVKSIVLNVLNSAQIAAQKSTIDIVDDYTANVLNSVPLPVIEKEKHTQSYRFNFKNLFSGLAVLVMGTFLFFLWIRPKKKALVTVENKPITTIREEEEKIKNLLKPGFEANLEYMKTLISNRDYSAFFATYEELQQDAEQHIQQKFGMGLKAFLENYKGSQFTEDFRNLEQQISIEKYSPIHDDSHLEELYNSITAMYSEIME